MVLNHSRRLHCHMVVVPFESGSELSICKHEHVERVVAAVVALLVKAQVGNRHSQECHLALISLSQQHQCICQSLVH